jgi:hypothetical protein
MFEHSLMKDSSGKTELIMTTLSKIFLAASVTSLAAGGILDFGGFNVIPAAATVLPLGAIFFGMFMIALLTEKMMAEFDQETAERMQLIKCRAPAPMPTQAGENKFVPGPFVSAPANPNAT